MDLGFIGTGAIAAAVVTGIAGEGHRVVVSSRGAAQAARLAAAFDCVDVAGNQGVVDRSEVVFLGLLAAQAPDVLQALRFRAGQRVISFIAEIALDEISALVAPAEAVAVMLPFPAIAQGGSPILTLGDAALVRAIFCPANTVFEMADAEELRAFLCAQAVLSPAVLLLAGAADWLQGQGVEMARADGFLRALVGANLRAGSCRETLAALATPGGYNLRLRQSLEREGLQAMLTAGLQALQATD
jgi:pyrroline-5-carboxylate reductase